MPPPAHLARLCLLALLAALPTAADPTVAEKVGEYLATGDETRAGVLEKELKALPLAELEAAIAEARCGAATAEPREEFELTVPSNGGKTRVCVATPEGYDGTKAWPLIVSMHGTGGDPEGPRDQFNAAGGRPPCFVVAPAEQEKYQGKGWGSTEDERSLNLAALDQALRRWRIDPDRVFLSGTSRGGHATWEIGLLFADRFAGLFAMAGGPRIVNFGYLENLGRVPLLESVGSQDQAQLLENVHDAFHRFGDWKFDATLREHADLGHGVGNEDVPEFLKWIPAKKRDLYPKSIVHAFSRRNQGRAYWLEATKLSANVVDPAEKPQSVPVPPGQTLSEAQKREAYLKKVDDWVARFEATVAGNVIEIKSKKVTQFTVYLSDRLVNLDQPVEIRVNGKSRFKKPVPRDAATLLRHVRATGDRARLFSAVVQVEAGS